jgi:molybdate transport system ATP-binding protein
MIDIDIGIDRGDFRLDAAFCCSARLTALFGRSGSGKSTLIAAVAGLLRPERGRIIIDEVTLFDASTGLFVPPHRRRVGFVFQDAQLFPHLSVRHNLGYGRWFAPREADQFGFDQIVDTLGLDRLLDRSVPSLSGGERQRVAIGRALLARPRLLLMDEPLASLDAPRKVEILPLIERLRDEFAVPVLYVSHAVEEVARLAGEVVVLEGGRVVRCGPPGEVLTPAGLSPSEGRFGTVSLITARIAAHDEAYGLTTLDHPAGAISVPGRAGEPGSLARVLVRGTDVTLAVKRPRGVSIRTILRGVVKATTIDEGALARVDVALTGGEILAAFVTRRSLDELGLGEGDAVFAMIKAASIEEGAGR